MTTRATTDAPPQVHHSGPPLLLPALVYTALVVAGAFTLGSTMGASFDPAHPAAFLASVDQPTRWGSFFEFGSAVPLLVFVATTVSRLRFLRVRAAGEVIALSGGLGAAAMLMFSALSGWSLTRPGVAQTDGSIALLKALAFAGGGPGYVVPLGLFIAGVSITAGLYRLIPRWIMVLGLVVAVACELASITLITYNAAYFIPVGRFLGIVWMIAVAFTLPSSIPASRASSGA